MRARCDRLPRGPISKFATAFGTIDANFEIEKISSNFMILARFLNLKLL